MSHILNTVLQKCWKFSTLSRKHVFCSQVIGVSIKNGLFVLFNRYLGQVLFSLGGREVCVHLFGVFVRTFSQSIVHLLDTSNFGAVNNHKHRVVRLSLLLIMPLHSANTDSFSHFALKWRLPVLSQETTQVGFLNKCKTHRNYVNVAQLFIWSNR